MTVQPAWAQEKPAATPPPPEVEVMTVIQKDLPVFKEWVASTDGLVNAVIQAQVQGYLIRQNYKEGDFVRKGTLLFEIDPRPFQAGLDEARAALAKYEAVLTTRQATLKRILPLAKANAVSQKDKDDAVGSVQAAEAEVLQARANYRKKALDLEFTKITSPIDGIAGLANAQIGDLVGTPQSKPLTTISTVDPIKVYVSLSETEYLQLAPEAKERASSGGAHMPLELILADGSTWKHQGRFAYADRQVDPQTGTLKVATTFPNPDNFLRPGQYARIRAVIKQEAGALLVPQRAVSELQGRYQVAVVDADNVVQLRTVKVGERSENLWVITEGLKPGERIVSEGLQKVKDGLKVTPKVK
ncbi:MAG: efflux RND transporter periplasmic adaptor subunit [Syntrophobacteraceae bacterium]|jgi:membrane fusion protein (multidrug efflux system)|nr:efflux RND transporter periplasmic adaptor subunit [Syntrophobacteraceae bacterium]